MNEDKTRTAEQIFADMHRELRSWNRDVPESPDRMDPLLRILLKLYADQLANIDSRIGQTWQEASRALIKSVCPESMRWPIPAHTVIRAEPTDPVVEIDPQTLFFYKEERDDGRTFFFSSLRKEKLIQATLKYLYFTIGDNLIDLSPQPPESTKVTSRRQVSSLSGDGAEVYAALAHDGPASDFEGATIFLNGQKEALKQLRWAHWSPGGKDEFDRETQFCPGLIGSLDDMLATNGKTINWGGLRQSHDLFRPLEDHFIIIPDKFVSAWQPGPPDKKLKELLNKNGLDTGTEEKRLFWIRLKLPPGGDRAVFQSPFEIYLNCFIAVNKNELTLFRHTGGNRLIEIELPEDIDNILEVISVVDSNGQDYVARHETPTGDAAKFYAIEERDRRLVLWFDFTSQIELPPDSITVNYSVTTGSEANGISAGKINDLYEKHPGLTGGANILPVTGAIPAKNDDQIVTEVAARLRGRDRALSFKELINWIKTFDPRIIEAECGRGVQRTENGVRKCIAVTVTVKKADFYSDDEIKLLKIRLESFLKSRTSVNSQFMLEIAKK